MLYAVYFSPTHGTRTCVRMVAGCAEKEFSEIDLTLPSGRTGNHVFDSDDHVIIGVPVYCGRIPQLDDLFRTLHGDGAKALLVAAYGNRAYEDALLELSQKVSERGFQVAGAIAMPAPHCYVPSEVCPDRPDESDRQRIAEFLKTFSWNVSTPLNLPGNDPYRPYPSLPFLPETVENCLHCGKCEQLCPAEAISGDETDAEKCIRCMACVQNCPVHSRIVNHPVFAGFQEKLRGLAKIRKEPQFFA